MSALSSTASMSNRGDAPASEIPNHCLVLHAKPLPTPESQAALRVPFTEYTSLGRTYQGQWAQFQDLAYFLNKNDHNPSENQNQTFTVEDFGTWRTLMVTVTRSFDSQGRPDSVTVLHEFEPPIHPTTQVSNPVLSGSARSLLAFPCPKTLSYVSGITSWRIGDEDTPQSVKTVIVTYQVLWDVDNAWRSHLGADAFEITSQLPPKVSEGAADKPADATT